MRIVGAFYVLLGIMFVPQLNEPRLGVAIPALAAPERTVAYRALLDWMFVLGLDLVVIGAALLWFSRRPREAVGLVYAVVALELVRGALYDVYYVTQGYATTAFYVVFIPLHLVIVGTGIAFARDAQRSPAVAMPPRTPPSATM
jgi:hypothetical protein